MSTKDQFFVGVDLHKTVVQVCVLDRAGSVVDEIKERIESRAAGEEVIAQLDPYLATGRIAVEAIGVNRWFVNRLLEQHRDIVICDPTKLNLKLLGKKTDRRDAFEIARRLQLGDIDRNATTYYPFDDEYGKRKVIRIRQKLVRMRQQLINQIRAMLNAYKISGFPGRLTSQKNLAALTRLELPTTELTAVLQTCVGLLESYTQAIIALDRRIEELAQATLPSYLRQLPSVGALTALILVHELGDVRRFKNAKAAACYAGLVPRVNQSADKAHHGALTKRGNRELRHILGEWAVRLLARDPLVRDWARSRLSRSHKNKVRMALARRLIIGVYKMLRTGECFSLERCLN